MTKLFDWIYTLGVKDKILAYPIAPIFLLHFYLTWPVTEKQLRSDPATNISMGWAAAAGFIGRILSLLQRRGEKVR